ncbi:MAG: transposase [Candidatus Omnitrophica bacterium]|nr:transposase [Candidatus Omnitrophota bacterium]
MTLKSRKNIRLERIIYEEPGRIFSITICAFSNKQIFLNKNLADVVWSAAKDGIFSTETDLMAVCLMSDHLHLLIGVKNKNLIDLISRWKRFTQKIVYDVGYKDKLWQRSFYDHALRREEQVNVVARYIYENPIRAGSVAEKGNYQYRWHVWL